jgi:hypothetical protein
MNDFSDVENELKKLRPAQPSENLIARVERALAEPAKSRASVSDANDGWWWRFTENPYKIGFALAAAAALFIVLAQISTDRTPKRRESVVQFSPVPETRSVLPARRGGSRAEGSTSSNEFLPAAATQVVYNTRDEGLQFTDRSEQPLRRLRYQTQETWQWRNPATGASLRVSYPSEEVVLIPISGQ